MKSLQLIALAIVSLILVSEVPAHAYVDGGTGSYILQISIAALWGIGFAFRASIQKVIAKLHRTDKGKPGSSSDD
ncbi:MAG: hypothetical protein ACYC27_04025 [Armatimonadota bacterium]